MSVPIASDHAGFEAKEKVKKVLTKLGYQPKDLGTHSDESVDYPEFAVKVAKDINAGHHERGILICGSGQGVCMTANKYSNIRAALAYDEESAEMSRKHNNANILCLPSRKLDSSQLTSIVKKWLNTDFEGGRHQRRTDKIKDLTKNE